MERTKVTSSSIESIGYSEEDLILVIEFKNGSVYHYDSVSPIIYRKLMNSDKKGSFVHEHIKGMYEFKKVKMKNNGNNEDICEKTTKMEDKNPNKGELMNCFLDCVAELIRTSGLNNAEIVGCLETLKIDLLINDGCVVIDGKPLENIDDVDEN